MFWTLTNIMIKSISCIVPIYGLTQNKNLQYFEELLESLFIAIPCLGDNFELIIVNDDRKRISRKLVLDICKNTDYRNTLFMRKILRIGDKLLAET